MKCLSCSQNATLAALPPRDRVHIGSNWRIAHAWSALPGWLLVISLRHVVGLNELTVDEGSELGSMLRQASAALVEVTGCSKTYVVSYGEQPGYEHLHLHVVPRMSEFDERQIGGGVFQFLKCPESEWVLPAERDALSAALASRWT